MSPLHCWAVLLQQTRQQSRESAALGEALAGPLAQRLSHIAEDVGRLVKKVRPLPWARRVRVAPGSAGGRSGPGRGGVSGGAPRTLTLGPCTLRARIWSSSCRRSCWRWCRSCRR